MPLSFYDRFHLVEHLLAPPGDRHVEGDNRNWPGRLVVPHLSSASSSDWPGPGRAEIDDHRRAAGSSRARAALEIVRRRIGAHERHFEMRMRIDPAGDDITASEASIQRLLTSEVSPSPISAIFCHPQSTHRPCQVPIRRHHRAAFDHLCSWIGTLPVFYGSKPASSRPRLGLLPALKSSGGQNGSEDGCCVPRKSLMVSKTRNAESASVC